MPDVWAWALAVGIVSSRWFDHGGDSLIDVPQLVAIAGGAGLILLVATLSPALSCSLASGVFLRPTARGTDHAVIIRATASSPPIL